MSSVAILASGMVTGVGLTTAATCAALRAAVSGFAETAFKDQGGEWILGCAVPLDPPWRGHQRLVHLAAPAVRECLAAAGAVPPGEIPLLLCVAEPERPGRTAGLDDRLLPELQAALGARFHPRSEVLARGRVGGAIALDQARRLLREEGVTLCIVAGVDCLLTAAAVASYEARDRLLTSRNSNGFIPGEAGTAVLVGPPRGAGGPEFLCRGIGFGHEEATVESDEPLRGGGLVQAFRAAYRDGLCTSDAVDYRLTDISGEQYYFKEAALAEGRTLHKLKPRFDLFHPADCIGEVGAAIGPCVFGAARDAALKGYAQGPGVLCHFSNDDGARAALILRYEEGPTSG